MKKIFSLLLILTASITAMAQGRHYSMLKLRLSDGTPISVNIDGRYISRQTNSLTLDGLRPGWHRVEVYRTGGNRRRAVRMYTGTIRLKPGTVNIAVVDVSGRIFRMRSRDMNEQDRKAYADGKDQRDESDHDNEPAEHNNYDSDDIYDKRDNREPDHNGTTQDGYGSFPRGRGSSSNTQRPENGLSQQDMDELQKRVNGKITDTDKEKLLKDALRSRSLLTEQVRIILGWLSFESTRLDFAKWAYSRSADPENYSKLEDVFDFSSSKEEFNSVIPER